MFFELIQVVIGKRSHLSRIPTDEDWLEIFLTAEKQGLEGIIFSAIAKLKKVDASIMPPEELYYDWLEVVVDIELSNKELFQAAETLSHVFKNGGLRCCVLKGQGLSLLYPEPQRRVPGDIDLWVEGSREHTLQFLRDKCFGVGKIVIHHVDTEILDGIQTEIHFIPSYTYNHFRYRKYQKFFKEEAEEQFSHFDEKVGFAYPTNRFNAVYCLMHIFCHIFNEGIGLRQLLDYYYVLLQLSEEERKWAYGKLKWMGLGKFTGAIMYVEQKVFCLETEYLLCQPSEEVGRLIMDEIMQGGNFGKFGAHYRLAHSKNWIFLKFMKLIRLFKLISICPSEVLWAPIWKPAHHVWRLAKGYIY